MSDDQQRVSLDMLETRLREAERELVAAIQKRARAGAHMRTALRGQGDALAMAVMTCLERLKRQSAKLDLAELMLRWHVEFPLDMYDAGLQNVIVSGAEQHRIIEQARNMFGYAAPLQYNKDQRECLTMCMDKEGTIGFMGWVMGPGAGQWWPMLNETRYHDMRIVGSWPSFSDDTPQAALIAKGPLAELSDHRTLLIAHDDHHRLQKIFAEVELEVTEISRARTLVLFEIGFPVSESDPRLAAARNAGLEGLRVVGSLPAPNVKESVAA